MDGPETSATSRPLAGIAVVGCSVAFAGLGLVDLFVFSLDQITNWFNLVYEVFINAGLAGGAAVLGYQTLTGELTDDDVVLAAKWFFGGIAFLWALVLWSNVDNLLAGTSILSYASSFVVLGGLGGLGGILAGRNRAQAQQNRRLLAEVREKRQTLQFINRLLRHDGMNGLNVIDARAKFLQSSIADEADRQHLEVISRRCGQLQELNESARVFASALDEMEMERVNLEDLVEAEVASFRDQYPDVEVSVDIESDVEVRGGDFLSSALWNVLENAVEHNDTDKPAVWVKVREQDGVGVGRVVDNGPGIPDEQKEEILETPTADEGSSTGGFGLYLVNTVVEGYDGSVSISDNDPRGSVVTFELPKAA
ncbi:sensor histidine kinase [Haloarchaeobius sp. DFWS5]|uniref:sensor histidine kinase n=1 Tax=Haloarchaeobius sp. DFWS5 TaxID=3446114 RepID=UPI003EBF35A8